MNHRPKLIVAIAAAVLALLTVCVQKDGRIGRINPSDPGGDNYYPPTVTVVPGHVFVNIGDTVTITASATDVNGTIKAICWALDGVNFSCTSTDSVAKVSYQSSGEMRVLVKAIDNDSLESAVDTVFIQVKGNAPILIEPQNGAIVNTVEPLMVWYSGVYSAFYSVLLDTVSVPVAIAKDSVTDTFFVTPTGLSYGHTYYWSVIGHSNNGLSNASEIRSFTTPNIIVENGLVAFFPFNGNAKDESGHGLRATVNGATLTADRFGNSGRAYLFNGSSQNISIADTSVISFTIRQDFTVSFWIKTTSTKSDMFPFMKYSYTGNGSGYYFIINHPSSPCAGAGAPSFYVGFGTPACSASPLNDDAWHHLAGLYSGTDSSITLYVDGVVQTKTGVKGHADVAILSPLIFGGASPVFYAGSLDDIRIYNRVLTQNEILGVYHENGWTGK